MSTGEVGHRNLPRGLALGQQPGGPLLLLRPQRGEPPGAAVHWDWAVGGSTGGRGFVVLARAHVVIGIFLPEIKKENLTFNKANSMERKMYIVLKSLWTCKYGNSVCVCVCERKSGLWNYDFNHTRCLNPSIRLGPSYPLYGWMFSI